MEYFPYGKTETDWLKSRDPILGAAIDTIEPIRREVIPDLFEALIHSVVGQQISRKAHTTVWNRFLERFCPLTPEALASAEPEEIQKCGTSLKKADNIRNVARAVLEKQVDLNALADMPDEEVCKSLCQLKGIGVWTAEMLMIFSMRRPNILSYGDLGIQRGLRMLYTQKKITPSLFAEYRQRYAPYATVAGLYIWAIAGGAMGELSDPAAEK